MLSLMRAALAAGLLAWFVSLGGGATASDPVPSSPHRRHTQDSRPGATLPFTATAYCQSGVTRSGVDTHTGIVAADPAELPVGSVVQLDTQMLKYNGIYTVLDTGTKVLGHRLDVYMHDCHEALHFGRQEVRVTVLRKGWSPKDSASRTVVAGLAGK